MVNCCGRTHIIYPFTTYNGIGRDDYYLMYLREGKLKTLIGDVECIATPGDFIIFPPHYKYKYTFAAGNSLVYYFVHFTGSEAERYLKKLFGDNFPCLLHAGDSDAAIDSFSRMFDAYGKDVEICDTVSAVSNCFTALVYHVPSVLSSGFFKKMRFFSKRAAFGKNFFLFLAFFVHKILDFKIMV